MSTIKEPETLEGLFYFANRTLEKGYIKAWAYKLKCDVCGEYMEKPRTKTGKPDKKAKFYVCRKCGKQMDKKEYESLLVVEIKYKCPYCGYEGFTSVKGFKRKKLGDKKGIIFKCVNCGKDLIIEQLKK